MQTERKGANVARNVHARSISIPLELEAEIEQVAAFEGISFSATVVKMCQRSLHMDFDKAYVPHISQVVNDAADEVVRRLSSVVNIGIEDGAEFLLRELKDGDEDER